MRVGLVLVRNQVAAKALIGRSEPDSRGVRRDIQWRLPQPEPRCVLNSVGRLWSNTLRSIDKIARAAVRVSGSFLLMTHRF